MRDGTAVWIQQLFSHSQNMKFISLLFSLLPCLMLAQTVPSVSPTMFIINKDGMEEEVTEYDGDAPLKSFFYAKPKDVGDYQPVYVWTITRMGETDPFIKRYAEDMDYEFLQTGTFRIELHTTFIQGTDTLDFAMDAPFSVTITESKLEVPNAFSPNGDGMNDVLKVKEDYRSIVSFHAMVFTRWGKKIYEWSDLDGGWDGRMGGSYAPDGAYFLKIDAQGADGKKYEIRKTITLLKGYKEDTK